MSVIYDTPLVNPLPGGLYSAATLIDYDVSRLSTGVLVHTQNCNTGYGTWNITCGAPVYEVQSITMTAATAGSFTLSDGNGHTTAAIPWNATSTQVQAAMVAAGFDPVTVTGGPFPSATMTVTFTTAGNKPQITANSASLTGGTVSTATITNGQVAKDGNRSADTTFDGSGIWAADVCGLKYEDVAKAAAQQTLRLNERDMVEALFGARLLADTAVPLTLPIGEVSAFPRAVGVLEAYLGYFPGVIHADLHFRAWAQRYNLILPGDKTPQGHQWAFGSGYDALGDSLVATGPVAVHRGAVALTEGLGIPTKNSREIVAEREVAVTYECRIARVVVPNS